MAKKPIVRMGNVFLYTEAESVLEFNTPFLHALVSDLFDTMYALEAVGIAAPQIGIPKKVIVFGFEHSEQFHYADAIAPTVLINPKIRYLSGDSNDDWEDCLSAAGLHGLVTRYTHIEYSGYNLYGEFFKRVASGFHARVVQHEYDHIMGKLYLSSLSDLKYFGFEEELKELMSCTGSKLK